MFCIYNECLIVICSRVTVKRRSGKKDPSWACWFQQSVESGDTSDEEAPPCDPKSNALMQKEQLKAISMLVAVETEDGLRRSAIMVVTKIFGLACAEQKVHVSWAWLILQNFVCPKKLVMYSLISSYFSKCGGRLPHEVLRQSIFPISSHTE